MIALPTRAAINFHDGPLPEYAGLNTPVWALLNGETQHGVTWHLMTREVDRGDILAQRRFDLTDSETALTLNTRSSPLTGSAPSPPVVACHKSQADQTNPVR